MTRRPTPFTTPEARTFLASLPTPTDATCGCGCAQPAKRSFLPGHDAKLKGQLVRLAASPSVKRSLRADAVERLLVRGWGRFVKPGSIDDLGMLPTVDPTDRRRRVDVCHADNVVEYVTDKAGVSHSHPYCPHVEGDVVRHPAADPRTGWLCSGCVEVATPAERASRQALYAWVLDSPSDTCENRRSELIEWYARAAAVSAEAKRVRAMVVLDLLLDPTHSAWLEAEAAELVASTLVTA